MLSTQHLVTPCNPPTKVFPFPDQVSSEAFAKLADFGNGIKAARLSAPIIKPPQFTEKVII